MERSNQLWPLVLFSIVTFLTLTFLVYVLVRAIEWARALYCRWRALLLQREQFNLAWPIGTGAAVELEEPFLPT